MRSCGSTTGDLAALEKVTRKLGGPVVAPSRTPQPKGPRQKTDRRDVLQLARLHRAGELEAIEVPDAVDESVQDLTRTRADAVDDLRQAKQRLKSLLLRQGYPSPG